MSKKELKKELNKLTKDQLLNQILDLYGRNKFVKEFYEFYLHPEKEKDLAQKYTAIIRKEFDYHGSGYPKTRFSVAKRAISDFKSLSPSAESLADVMMTLPELACELSFEAGDLEERFYDGCCNNFENALKFIQKNGLLEKFQKRAEKCVKWAEPCGYGFPDEISGIYEEYYKS